MRGEEKGKRGSREPVQPEAGKEFNEAAAGKRSVKTPHKGALGGKSIVVEGPSTDRNPEN